MSTATTKQECAVCYETSGVSVVCAKCDVKSCVGCFQTYLLNSTLTPSCMSCKANLSDDFVLQNTQASWRYNKYKPYREELLYDMEKARLPETQQYAEIYMKARDLTATATAGLKAIEEDWLTSVPELNKLTASGDYMAAKMLVWAQEAKSHVHKSVIATCKRSINTFGTVDWEGVRIKAAPRRAVVKACITNGCSGFLDEAFACGLCSVKVCKGCHEAKVEGHECNEDTVATIKAIKAEARGCPKCATLISKIDGCDQMWCTQCHATFSWRTGQVEEGHTHNPHFYEYMRKNGGMPRAPGDGPVACGFPGISAVIDSIMNKELKARYQTHAWNTAVKGETMECGNLTPNDKLVYQLVESHRHMIHIEETVRRRLNVDVPDNHQLRVQLLTKEITTEKMKTLIQQRDKAYRKNLAKSQVYQMAYTVSGDLFRVLIQNKNTVGTKKELDALLRYSNECLDKIAESYGCKVEHYTILN